MLNLVANGPSGYTISNSLRFRASASAYLSRTPSSAGNRQKWTWSSWVKRGIVDTSDLRTLFGINVNTSADITTIIFQTDNTLRLFARNSGTQVANVASTAVYRDPSAWYHIVVAIDTTQATAANRVRLYVNGSEITAFSSAVYPAQNTSFILNTSGNEHDISRENTGQYFDGYQTEINFIDGQQLTPSSFGSTNALTGVWQPAKYTGTYGTNGFYLQFSSIATTSGSNTGLGKDFSGNGNYWNTNNISVTSGTTYDAMTDVPTLTSATVGNYATLSPIDNYNMTLSNANLTFATTSGASYVSRSTISMTSGKWYWEVIPSTSGTSSPQIGVTSSTTPIANAGYNGATDTYYYWGFNGNKYFGTSNAAYGASFTSGDVIGVALDMDAGTLTFYKNNVSQGTAFTGLTGKALSASVSDPGGLTNIGGSINFGQRPFTYTPPTGYVALNTYNLPTSTIVQGNKYMDATTYTGTGATQVVTNAGSMKPDFVWLKIRSAASNHVLINSTTGVTAYLNSNTTGAEQTSSDQFTSFNSNGFTLGANTTGGNTNANGSTYVGWQWQAGQGSTSSNTSGSITSTVSVNASAGFSIVTYTGTGANATVGHGLGIAPKMIFIKNRSSGSLNWGVYNATVGNTKVLLLNTTAAASAADPSFWNNTSPTSTTFSLSTWPEANNNGNNFIAYCWAEIAGFSKFTSYTGNGSADGPFIYLGFRPKYIMIKRTDSTANWEIIDSSRSTYNATANTLYANLSVAEDVGTGSGYYPTDFLSNGFKIRGDSVSAGYNANGGTYIVAAWAENPLKNSLAR